jgi:hypothetical protein
MTDVKVSPLAGGMVNMPREEWDAVRAEMAVLRAEVDRMRGQRRVIEQLEQTVQELRARK